MDIAGADKQYVRSLFNAIAYRYDLLNHLLSGGIDLYWRRKAIEHLRPHAPRTILDVATGTGDFALASLRLGPERVVGVDIAEKMLAVGREKLRRRGVQDRVTFELGDAERLAFSDGTFDAAIVAFGVRNFENLNQGLREMRRVLNPRGRVVILEFSRPQAAPFRQLYLAYFRTILPLVGRLVSGHTGAYTYLPDTVMRFPEGPAFLEHLRASGFDDLREERLTFGIATMYSGRRSPLPSSHTSLESQP
jgi:demethylmenaquinone methyltransferase/2-methoxy-6-polyprenyl-1,4-benzoquinol methylase